MSFLLSPCVLWISTCISFLSAESIISVSAPLNSKVLLPCNVTPDPSQTPHVRWTIGSETVFERRGKRIYQAEGYEDRVDVPEDELLKGNCSLVLKNVRATDANIYRSFMAGNNMKRYVHWDFVQDVKLNIDETQMSDKETPEEIPSGTSVPGINSHKTLIIYLVITCVLAVVLVIITVMVFRLVLKRRRRRRNINQPSNEAEIKIGVDVEHQVFVDS